MRPRHSPDEVDSSRHASRLIKADYEDRLRLMRNATELRVANIIEDLQVLALSPSLSEGRFADFREHAIQAVKLIGGAAIALYAPDGQQLVNTRLDVDTPLPKRGRIRCRTSGDRDCYLKSPVFRGQSWMDSGSSR